MRFTLATSLSLLPVLAWADQAPLSTPNTGIKVPLLKGTPKSSLVADNDSADVEYLKRHLQYTQVKIQRGLDAYEKNTGEPHPGAATRFSVKTKEESGGVPLVDDQSQLWYGTISLGTPPKDYTVDFDSGSSDLFLPGPSCDSTCDGHSVYDPSKSSTATKLGTKFSLSYGDGSTVSGIQYTDTVSISGLAATGQTLGAADKYSTGFENAQFPADGLMGMAFQKISDYNASPLFQSLVSQGVTEAATFAFKLAATGAELYIGGVNDELYQGEFTYAHVTTPAYWSVDMDSVLVNGKRALGTTKAIIDTGTTLIVGDKKSVAKVYKAIPGSKDASKTLGAGFYTVPCESIPTISLTFGGKSFAVSSDTFNLGPASSGSSDCVGGLTSGDVASIGWIVGDVFLQNVYTVFDYGNTQVGFADLAGASVNADATARVEL